MQKCPNKTVCLLWSRTQDHVQDVCLRSRSLTRREN